MRQKGLVSVVVVALLAVLGGVVSHAATSPLTESAPGQRVYRYRIESSPIPVRDYVAEFRVDDNGDGTSTVVWSAEFEPTVTDFRTVENIRDFLKTGLGAIVDLHRPVLKYTS